MQIEKRKISDLKYAEYNPRKRLKKGDPEYIKLRNSIEKFGYVEPVIVNERTGNIVGGHQRITVLKDIGEKEADCVIVNLDEQDEKALNIALNKISGEWDSVKLEEVLRDLKLNEYDVELTGFDLAEIDGLLGLQQELEAEEDDFDSEAELANITEPTTKRGQVWKLGNHRLMCGDSTIEADVEKLMNGEKADMVFTDPPYNVNYTDGQNKERKILNDHFSSDEQCGEVLWLPSFINMRNSCKGKCAYYMTMPQGGTHMMMMMMMVRAGWQVKHELIWRKQSIVLNRADYNYQHEPISYGWNKTHEFYGNGKFRNTSVWEINRPTKSKEHPTMKPIELVCEALMNSSQQNHLVLDLFGGSGTTLIACEQLNRVCYMMELDEKYCDVIIRRWEKLTGETATLIEE